MILTVDLEFLDRTKDEVERLLALLKKYKARATFFIVTSQIPRHEKLIRKISKVHEIASHSDSHINMSRLHPSKIAKEVEISKNKIEGLDIDCIGFRSPYNLPPAQLGKHLKKAGYGYDSSICNTFFPFRYNNRNVQNKPYMASSRNIKKPGNCLLEFPISNFSLLKLPSLLSFLKLSHPLIRPFDFRDKVFSMHDYDLKKGIYDYNAGMIVRGIQKIRSGEKSFSILNAILKKQNQVFSCKDYLERLKS